MRRPLLILALAATALLPVASAHAFTFKRASLSKRNGRLAYELLICSSSKTMLRMEGTFTPKRHGSGARTAKPGATQYQDHGCYPAVVSIPIVKHSGSCVPAYCPAVHDRRYVARLRITDPKTGKSKRTPLRSRRV